jgi:hypothetical protein
MSWSVQRKASLLIVALMLLPLSQADASGYAPGQLPAAEARARMVSSQIEARGVHHAAVLAAMRAEPRHLYVPESLRDLAYDDCPLAIGPDQTN